MIKETRLGGFSAMPPDYEAQDGDLSTALGVVSENGSLSPMLEPSIVMTFPKKSMRVVCVHETSVFHYYIVHDTETGDVFYTEQGQVGTPILNAVHSFEATRIYGFATIGNTLLVLTEEGMHYFLWKSKAKGYQFLGTHLPECPISFGLQTEVVRTDEFSISFDGISEGDIFNEFSDDNKTKVTSQVLAKVNKFIAEESTNKGRFIFPFLVRYAYRLYDGSLTMHSAPVLMIASSDLAPQVFYEHITGKKSYTDARLRVMGALSRLDYAVIGQSYIDTLDNWKDIIRSVDIFISKPIYTYDQNGKCTGFKQSTDIDSYCVCKHVNQNVDPLGTKYPLRYQRQTFNHLYAFTFGDPFKASTEWTYPAGRLMIPRRSADSVREDIRSCSQFFLLESIKVESLTTTRTLIDVEEDYLQSLLNREVMTDDYDSHDTLVPKYSFSYNSRLNIANMRKKLFGGYNAGAQFCYTNGFTGVGDGGAPETTFSDSTNPYAVFFVIKQDGRDIVVRGDSYSLATMRTPTLFVYYPNVNAYKAYIVSYQYFNTVYEVPLQAHEFLNGAFYFGGWGNPASGGSLPSVASTEERTIDVPNKIYTSEVNDPFFFPTTGINTVGTGTILGICAAVKALSQGQFGQFPLYAFSTDGVWALEVSSTGSYSAKQPVTREVCINPGSITQMDSAVLFATNRGIMLISGSTATCITDIINNEVPLSLPELPYINKVLEKYKSLLPDVSKALLGSVTIVPFIEYLRECRMVFDYTHQRIIVYNAGQAYAYVYSLKTQQWGMTLSDMTETVNSYPEALAMTDGANLVDFSSSTASGGAALVVTRPFKLDDPNALKTIDTIIVRGTFRKGHVQTVLYGSIDLYSWHLVSSSVDHHLRGFRGTPYKYFRLALVCNLEKGESVYSFTTQYTPRLGNRPR